MAQEIKIRRDSIDLNMISSPALAFLGDSVFEINIRRRMVSDNRKSVGIISSMSKSYTNAAAQARMADRILDLLTSEETAVFKRGRNHKTVSAPKSCTISEYRRATGLEALFGFLYLSGRQDRIDELIDKGLAWLDMQSNDNE